MNPTAFGKNLSVDVSSENGENSLCHDANDQIEACVITGQSFIHFNKQDKIWQQSKKNENFRAKKGKLKSTEEMIYKTDSNNTINSCSNSRSDSNDLGVTKRAKSVEESSSTAKQTSKLTEIVKEIAEKRRQTSSESCDANSTFRGRFAINGVTTTTRGSFKDENFKTENFLTKNSSLRQKIAKVSRRKQRPQKAIANKKILPLTTCDSGVK